jgi:anthranilate synthase component 1
VRKAISASAETLRRLAYSDPDSFPVLFDSAAEGPLGRYSILAAYPQATLWLDEYGCVHTDGRIVAPARGFLASLEQAWQSSSDGESGTTAEESSLPFRGGWVVYLAYDVGTEIEPRLNLRLPPDGGSSGSGPVAMALRVPAGIVYDHLHAQAWAFAESDTQHLLPRLELAAATLPPQLAPVQTDVRVVEEDPQHFRARVESALSYIGAGDIYQANLSRPWRAQSADPHMARRAAPGMYECLRAANPAPFAALAQFGDWRLLSSSPERLVRVKAARVDTRPIAGTRPRSRIDGHDEAEIAALIANAKERAEHVMLIDLERNDLGRICRAGSVRVDEFMAVESYAHVHHIVSNVCGERLPGVTPIGVLRSVFPGGTITGCPKFRCMQIIAELEGEARRAYTGALGYINLNGDMDFNILIRSLTLNGNRLEFRTGAGIVADSTWQRELAETQAKARGVLNALTRCALT